MGGSMFGGFEGFEGLSDCFPAASTAAVANPRKYNAAPVNNMTGDTIKSGVIAIVVTFSSSFPVCNIC